MKAILSLHHKLKFFTESIKIRKFVVNCMKLFIIFKEITRILVEKIHLNCETLKKKIYWMQFLQIWVMDSMVDFRLHVIDIFIFLEKINPYEWIQLIFFTNLIVWNTYQIIFPPKFSDCGEVFFLTYIFSLKFIKKVNDIFKNIFFQTILTIFFSYFLFFQSIEKNQKTVLFEYKNTFFFILIVSFYNLSFYLKFLKNQKQKNNHMVKALCTRGFKKIISYLHQERYNNCVCIKKSAVEINFNLSVRTNLKNHNYKKVNYIYFKKLIKNFNAHFIKKKTTILYLSNHYIKKNHPNLVVKFLNLNIMCTVLFYVSIYVKMRPKIDIKKVIILKKNPKKSPPLLGFFLFKSISWNRLSLFVFFLINLFPPWFFFFLEYYKKNSYLT